MIGIVIGVRPVKGSRRFATTLGIPKGDAWLVQEFEHKLGTQIIKNRYSKIRVHSYFSMFTISAQLVFFVFPFCGCCLAEADDGPGTVSASLLARKRHRHDIRDEIPTTERGFKGFLLMVQRLQIDLKAKI